MLREGVIGLIKGSIVDYEGIVDIEWLNRELFVAKKDGFDDKSGVNELIKGSILVFESIVEHESSSRLLTNAQVFSTLFFPRLVLPHPQIYQGEKN